MITPVLGHLLEFEIEDLARVIIQEHPGYFQGPLPAEKTAFKLFGQGVGYIFSGQCLVAVDI